MRAHLAFVSFFSNYKFNNFQLISQFQVKFLEENFSLNEIQDFGLRNYSTDIERKDPLIASIDHSWSYFDKVNKCLNYGIIDYVIKLIFCLEYKIFYLIQKREKFYFYVNGCKNSIYIFYNLN